VVPDPAHSSSEVGRPALREVCLPIEEAKWSARGILTHHRQQEANSPRNEAGEMMIIDGTGIGIGGTMVEDQGGEAAPAAQT
jgi:hypothetical protein